MQDFVQSKKSVVRVCAAKRSNESPSGAFKRQNGLAQQDGGASPRQVRVCAAKRSNESPSGAFKRQNGLAQQDGGASPRQVRVCAAKRSNESPSGAFKRQNGLAQQDGGASPRQVPVCVRIGCVVDECRPAKSCIKKRIYESANGQPELSTAEEVNVKNMEAFL